MRTYPFQNCIVHHDLCSGLAETTFVDGTTVAPYALVNPDELTAMQLGYGVDIATMAAERQMLHAWLSELIGLPFSPALWAVAHHLPSDFSPPWAWDQEAELVTAFQAYMNGLPASPALQPLIDRGFDLDQLRWQAASRFRADRNDVTLSA